jgi:hypothetical protein
VCPSAERAYKTNEMHENPDGYNAMIPRNALRIEELETNLKKNLLKRLGKDGESVCS